MMELLADLQSYHACEFFLIIAAALILVDYLFPTDWPAHFGYVSLGLSAFFGFWKTGPTVNLLPSALAGVGVWLALAILHQVFFWRILQNAPDATSNRGAAEPAVSASKEQSS